MPRVARVGGIGYECRRAHDASGAARSRPDLSGQPGGVVRLRHLRRLRGLARCRGHRRPGRVDVGARGLGRGVADPSRRFGVGRPLLRPGRSSPAVPGHDAVHVRGDGRGRAVALGSGGETSTSVSYLFEEAAPERRGLYGGLYLSSAAAGMAGGFAVVLLVQLVLTRAQLLQWGWRLPFLAAVPLALAVFWLRRRLEESPEFGPARRGPGSGVDGPVGRARSVPAVALSDVVGLVRRQRSTVVSGALLTG